MSFYIFVISMFFSWNSFALNFSCKAVLLKPSFKIRLSETEKMDIQSIAEESLKAAIGQFHDGRTLDSKEAVRIIDESLTRFLELEDHIRQEYFFTRAPLRTVVFIIENDRASVLNYIQDNIGLIMINAMGDKDSGLWIEPGSGFEPGSGSLLD